MVRSKLDAIDPKKSLCRERLSCGRIFPGPGTPSGVHLHPAVRRRYHYSRSYLPGVADGTAAHAAITSPRAEVNPVILSKSLGNPPWLLHHTISGALIHENDPAKGCQTHRRAVMRHHARWAAPGLAAVAAAALLAGCGGSGDPQNAGATSSASSRSSFAQCLKKHGITLPSRPSGGGRPSGIPSGGVRGSASPSGAPGGGQGFPGGGRSSAFQKAIKACGGFGGGGGFGGAPPG